MLGLGNSTSSPTAPQGTVLFDKTLTFQSSLDTDAFSEIGNSFTDSITQVGSVLIDGVATSDLMKITMADNDVSAGTAVIQVNNFFLPANGATITVKAEVDYALGKFNDSALRISTLALGSSSYQISGSTDQAVNTLIQVAPSTTVSVNTASNSNLSIFIPFGVDSGAANDIVYIKRIRVYETS